MDDKEIPMIAYDPVEKLYLARYESAVWLLGVGKTIEEAEADLRRVVENEQRGFV